MCLTCKIAGGEISPPGGIIHRDAHTLLHHCLDVAVPGYLILSPLRHAEDYASLTAGECRQLAAVARIAAACLKELPQVEKVYIASFGETTAHFHYHIFPRYRWLLAAAPELITTGGKLDGAKLFSHCRQKYAGPPPEPEKFQPLIAALADRIGKALPAKTK